MKKCLLGCFLFVLSSVAYSQTTVTTYGVTGNYTGPTTLEASEWRNPMRMVYDADSNLIAVSRTSHGIMKIDLANNEVTLIAGAGSNATGSNVFKDDVNPLEARFTAPRGVALDAAGNIYVADGTGHRIRKIAAPVDGVYGAVTTVAGTGTADVKDDADPLAAQFNAPVDLVVNNAGDIFVVETGNTGNNGGTSPNNIRKIAMVSPGVYGEVSTLATGYFENLFGIALDTDNNLIVVDRDEVLKVDATTGAISVIAGQQGVYGNTDGTLAQATFDRIFAVAVHHATGDIYVTHAGTNHSVRKIDRTNNLVSTVAGGNGTGVAGTVGVPVDGTVAQFAIPQGIAVNATANIFYIGDTNNSRIRKIVIGSLPVKLTSFTAQKQSNAVKLNWSTASETNNSHFDILRSADGNNAAIIGTVTGSGNSNDIKTYSYVDYAPLAGDNYYQLRQVDFDGSSELSEITVVKADLQQAALKVYASSANSEITLTVYSAKGGKASLKISDVQGNNIVAQEVVLGKGYSTLQLSVPLQKAVYVATLNNGSESISTKFIPQ